MIARLREPSTSCLDANREPQAIGELLPELLGRYGISANHVAAQGNFGSRFSKNAASPSAAASVVRAVALTAAPAANSVSNDSPMVSFNSRLVSSMASAAQVAISPAS
jgi:hypothetical protein